MNKIIAKQPNRKTLPLPGHYVKSRIVGAGIKLGDLAAAAGMTSGNLSQYLAGRLTGRAGQKKIFLAFRRLTGIRIRIADFWGPLLSERIAS